jgi:hypothetical protein
MKEMAIDFPGRGHKRPQLDLNIDQLHLDKENPRLPEEKQNKAEAEILKTLYEDFYLDELAESMARNGYFDEEPLVAIPQQLPEELREADPHSQEFLALVGNNDTQFTVVEGNRRLATANLLLNADSREGLHIKHWPEVSPEIANDLRTLPVIVYKTRIEIVPYLGVRHIVGIQKWDSYAKARYIAMMVNTGNSIDEVAESIGDKQGSVNKNYLCYRLLAQAKDELDIDLRKAKEDFSLLLLAVGQANVKQFLGLPKRSKDINFEEPLSVAQLPKLKNLLSWVFGEDGKLPVIRESRDITNLLTHVLGSPEAVKYLENTRDLTAAYDRTDGEEKMLLRYLASANTKLEVALGIAHRHKTFEVRSQVQKCEQTIDALQKTLRD